MRKWIAVLVCSLAGVGPAMAGAEGPSVEVEVGELMALSAEARASRLELWKVEANERLIQADRAVWDAQLVDTRTCREGRREDARRFLEVLEGFGAQLADPAVEEARQRVSATMLLRAWHPVQAVEPYAPCEAPDAPSNGLQIISTGPAEDGLADLPEAFFDDPMTLGPDLSSRRALRQ